MICLSRSQVQPKRQSAKAVGSPISSLLRKIFEWIQAMLLSSKQSSAGRTTQCKTTLRVHQRVPDARDRCASGGIV
jgi:hypothetical protein